MRMGKLSWHIEVKTITILLGRLIAQQNSNMFDIKKKIAYNVD